MKPFLEKVQVPPDASWAMLNRRLDKEIPFQWHHHPEFELTLTLNSRGQRYVGDNIDTYDDGDLVLLGPNLPHTWYSAQQIDASGPHVALVMWFKPEWAAALSTVLTELQPVQHMLASARRGLVFSQVTSQAVRPTIEAMPGLEPVERLTSLVAVLSTIAREKDPRPLTSPSTDQAVVTTPDKERIERLLAHIHSNYQAELSVDELADLACLSPSGFHRLFRRHTKLTVTAYIAQLRIGQACALLISTEQSVAHIADVVGYANLANFNRQFRALKAMTPREFRQSFRR